MPVAVLLPYVAFPVDFALVALARPPSPQTMLARIQGIVGPFPSWMLLEGEEASKYFTPDGFVYQRMDDGSCERQFFDSHGV